MTPEEYEQSLDRIAEGRRLFEEVVVSALRAGIASAEAQADAAEKASTELAALLKRERAQFEPERDRLVSLLESEQRSVTRLTTDLRESQKELAIVKRDRDALIQRAVTAENTLKNHGFDLHTMRRKESSAFLASRDMGGSSFQDGRDQPQGRYTRLDGTPIGEVRQPPPVGGNFLETGSKNP